jgi:hypothetical protein
MACRLASVLRLDRLDAQAIAGFRFNFKQKHRPEKYNPKNDFVEANDVPAWDELANRLEYIDKELEEIEKKRLAAKKIADDFLQRELAPLMQYRAN